MQPLLEFEGISKRYRALLPRREHWALRDFTLAVDRGEIVGFLGPNGAGKTTAIHIALGLTRATSGRGTLLGRPFGDAGSRRRVGFLPENAAFYHRSAREVVRLYGALNGLHDPELSRQASALLSVLGLDTEADHNIGKFSRGMLQRVGLAQALVNHPDLLILDEPTSALDPISRRQVRELLVHARAEGKSVFLSSHQLSEVELICDRVFFLQQGQVIASGRTQELLETADYCELTVSGGDGLPSSAPELRVEGDRLCFIIPVCEQRATIEQLWAEGRTLISVSPKTRTLEELFVELMQRKSGVPEPVPPARSEKAP